jgi:hypothetical protein
VKTKIYTKFRYRIAKNQGPGWINPVRNSSMALNPGGIVPECTPAAEQWDIISNGVRMRGYCGPAVYLIIFALQKLV